MYQLNRKTVIQLVFQSVRITQLEKKRNSNFVLIEHKRFIMQKKVWKYLNFNNFLSEKFQTSTESYHKSYLSELHASSVFHVLTCTDWRINDKGLRWT